MFCGDLETGANARKCAIRAARKLGFFSTWMSVLADDHDMRLRLINRFASIARNARIPNDPATRFRQATPAHLASLPSCFDCQRREDRAQ